MIIGFRGRFPSVSFGQNVLRFGFSPANVLVPTTVTVSYQHYSVSLTKPYIQFRFLPHGEIKPPPVVSTTPSGGTAVSRGPYKPAKKKVKELKTYTTPDLRSVVIPFARPIPKPIPVVVPALQEEDDTNLRLLLLLAA